MVRRPSPFLPNSTSGYIRFWDTRSSRMIVKVAASSADIRGALKTLAFGLSHRALPSGQPVHITVDDGVAESIGGLSCKGYNFTDQPFTIPRTPYAECHASADPHFKNFQNFHFSSNVTGTLLLAAHCPTGQPRTWEVFIYMETEPNSPPELTSWFMARSSVSSIIRPLRLMEFLFSCHIMTQVGTSTSCMKSFLFLCCTPRTISLSNTTAGDACR
uniref:uncharacterized protein n=1 Tax=Myxine glutinosa TaxID=7769 RepID=UPI00358E4221